MTELNYPAEHLSLTPLAYANGRPELMAIIRQQPADFRVEEILGFEPEGEGEHVFLWVEKTALNTQQVADALAKLANVAARQVSFSGMKDKNAITRQWFSVHLPGADNIDWQAINSPQIKLLTSTRHLRKLRRGVHRGNRFVITARNLQGATDSLTQRIAAITGTGVPNYFGEQRFGFDGANLRKAQQWFAGEFKPKRHQQGIYLSAARSWLFNQLLSQRVANQQWNKLLGGELLMLAGSHSVFPQDDDPELAQRLLDGDIHLTGPLYGKPGQGNKHCQQQVAVLEQALFDSYPQLLAGLEKAGLKAERRALRLIPENFEYQLDADVLECRFSLTSGCFATAVMRELLNYQVAGREA
ncbi:tRNA pseudouridine(13) synthase TruD [Oceanicoccus sp. KOV_DT_Chl]|uniref:tRNA pseudouridine(13) synthase TruD n=1 Tax=Oceanicoccus sp. KOV_DT_Chl TaxID=1904639 RepID=UPI001F2A32D5|nr:tRNA pseudouridine(13) synthase TruD [Oceanicoccus sp. KOV_DT_Chl]